MIDGSLPRYAFIVAVSSQSCSTTSMTTKASMPLTMVAR
jgi:hypothetical protein